MKATREQVREAIAHYESVQAQFGDDDLSPEYSEAIGDTPNFFVKPDGSVIVFREGGREEPVELTD